MLFKISFNREVDRRLCIIRDKSLLKTIFENKKVNDWEKRPRGIITKDINGKKIRGLKRDNL